MKEKNWYLLTVTATWYEGERHPCDSGKHAQSYEFKIQNVKFSAKDCKEAAIIAKKIIDKFCKQLPKAYDDGKHFNTEPKLIKVDLAKIIKFAMT